MVDEHTAIQTMAQVIVEVLVRQAQGIDFVERNAGKQLDMHMSWEGFRVTSGLGEHYPFPSGTSLRTEGIFIPVV